MGNLVENMKLSLLAELDEWLGFDIPEEGEEDYDAWQFRLQEIEDIKSTKDVCDYLSGLGRDEEGIAEFLANFDLTVSD